MKKYSDKARIASPEGAEQRCEKDGHQRGHLSRVAKINRLTVLLEDERRRETTVTNVAITDEDAQAAEKAEPMN